MKFSLAKLKAALGNQRAMEKEIVDTYTEDIINSIEKQPFAISNYNVCYAATNELAGYYFLQTIIVGKFKVKTFKGAQLTINGHDFEFVITSYSIHYTKLYETDPDAKAFASFIVQFLSDYNRWTSPKYLFGESYGTFRNNFV